MKNLKKVLSMIMAAAMLLSLMAVGTSAAFKDQEKIKNSTAVDMCSALNIINGYVDGSFGPTDTVTRAQMAKMICIALNGGSALTLGTKATPTYKDIDGHWAEAYIEYCASLGIVAGVGDGSFRPEDGITGTQAAKMLLVALGYNAVTEGFNGSTWAVKINVVASQKNLYKDLAIQPNAALTRDSAAQMIWNTLNAKMVKYVYSLTSENGVLKNIQIAEEYSDSRTILSSKYSEAEFEGQMVKFSYNSTKKEWTYSIKDSTATKTFTSKTDFTGLYGQNVNVVYKVKDGNVDKVFGMYAEDSNVLFSGIVNGLTVKTDSVKYDGTTYDLDGASAATKAYDFAYNTDITTASSTALDALTATQKPYSFDAVDYDDNGEVDFLILHPYIVKEVTYVGNKSVTAGSSYTFEDNAIYSGVKKGDYTKIIAAANTATNKTILNPVDKMVNGKVTSVSGSDYYIDKVCYNLASGVTMNVGDTVKDAVVVNGFIFDADTNGTTDVEDYAIVITAAGASGVNGDQAKLMFSDGTKKVVDTDKDYSALADKMVTFDTNSDKEYVLTEVSYASATGTGFDKAVDNTKKITNKDGTTASGEVKYINGYNVDADAVIFVKNTSDNSYTVISGAKLLNTSVSTLGLNGAFADDSSTSGFSAVQLAYITSSSDLTSADSLYGYALADYSVVKNSDNETVYQYTLWNGTKEVTVQSIKGLTNGDKVAEGSVVKYTTNSNGAVDTITVYSTTGTPAGDVCAITANDGTYIQVNNGATRYEIDEKDTTILYVNNDDVAGVAGGAIQLANENKGGAYGGYYANAVVLCTGNDVDLIVFDVNNDILNAQ